MAMASFCFSAPAILRCESFTRVQVQLLIVPTIFELCFSTAIIYTNGRSTRTFLLLTAEGWVYFTLALLELLSHILPAVRDSLSIFRIVDIVLAATSFLPLLLYTSFIYFLTRAVLLNTLPHRLQSLASTLLLILIPTIAVLTEFAAFLGVSYRLIDISGRLNVAIGFNDGKDRNLWTLFTNLTLALLTAYQAIASLLAFYRIIKGFVDQRHPEKTSDEGTDPLRGIAWIFGGLQIGAVETAIAFAQPSFGLAVTRRSLRLLSRACLCIGIFRRLDPAVGFEYIGAANKKPASSAQLRSMISNPRHSTFLQLSPSATTFHIASRANRGLNDTSLGARSNGGLAGMQDLAFLRDGTKQRVTVQYNGGAPSLHMRFSVLDVPAADTIVDSVKTKPPSEWTAPSRRSSSYYPSSFYMDKTELARTPIYARHTRAFSEYSARSNQDSLYVVRELAAQFPGLPPRVVEKGNQPGQVPWDDPYPTGPLNRSLSSTSQSSQSTRVSRGSSLTKRKPVPRLSDNIDPFSEEPEVEERFPSRDSTGKSSVLDEPGKTKSVSSPSTTFTDSPATNFTHAGATSVSTVTTPDNEDPFVFDEYASGVTSGKSRDLPYSLGDISGKGAPLPTIDTNIRNSQALRSPVHDITVAQIKQTVSPSRIKSVGKAPKRYTPAPIKTTLSRGSIYIEPIMIPPRQSGMPVAIQEGESFTATYTSALRDSEVLGVDGKNLLVRGGG